MHSIVVEDGGDRQKVIEGHVMENNDLETVLCHEPEGAQRSPSTDPKRRLDGASSARSLTGRAGSVVDRLSSEVNTPQLPWKERKSAE